MLICIGGVALVLHYGLNLGWGVSLLIGAILAPTDPVLATLVQVVDAQDDDQSVSACRMRQGSTMAWRFLRYAWTVPATGQWPGLVQ